jgi:thiamine kinase-like enzyme
LKEILLFFSAIDTVLPMKALSNDKIDSRAQRIVSAFIKLTYSSVNSADVNYISLKGGKSAATLYRCDISSTPYVLRLLPFNADPQTRLHQIRIAELAGNIGVGPKIHFIDPHHEGIIMEFLFGRTVQYGEFEDQDKLQQMAHLLKKLHQSSEAFPIAISPFTRFQNFVLKGQKAKTVYPERFFEIQDLMKHLEKLLWIDSDQMVPTHLDLHPENILFSNNQFLLVDWVNGGMSDLFFDLANFSVFQCLTETQNINLLRYYLGRDPTEFEWRRFILSQPIRLFVIAAAFFTAEIEEKLNQTSTDLSSLKDYLFENKKKEQSLQEIAWIMFQAGLQLIDDSNFKSILL